jgi:sulfonate transport system permease protein
VLFGIIVVGITGWGLNALARGVERRVLARRSGASRERAAA